MNMLAFLETPFATLLSVRATGTLTHADYQKVVPRAERVVHECGKVRLLIEFRDCQGCSVRAAWDVLGFALSYGSYVDRCAVIGDKNWQKWATTFFKLPLHARYFARSEMDDAW